MVTHGDAWSEVPSFCGADAGGADAGGADAGDDDDDDDDAPILWRPLPRRGALQGAPLLLLF